jgi:hypothetical protein
MATFVSLFALAIAGCGSNPSGSVSRNEGAVEPVDEHGHGTAGPHGGSIIELGEYHAELVHDDAAGTVTVYVLDNAAAENVPVDATEATINITHDGEGEPFKLTASPVEGEPAGWSSRFVSSDAHLISDLDEADAGAQFVVSIIGKQHRGTIEHQHEHEHENAPPSGDEHDHDQ